MRRIAVTTALILLSSSCVDEGAPSYPPADRFYYPTAVLHLPAAEPTSQGTLYVASSNWDGRYDYGALVAVELDAVSGLPPFLTVGATPPAEIPLVRELGAGDLTRQVRIDSFAGMRLVSFPLPSGGHRLFIPTRGERDRLEILDAQVPGAARPLSCLSPSEEDASICASPSLSEAELRNQGHPRATNPTAVALHPVTQQVWVTHRFPATDPLESFSNPLAFLVAVDAAAPVVSDASFHPLGRDGANGIALGERYAFVLGSVSERSRQQVPLLRLVDVTDLSRPVIDPGIELSVDVLDGRDVQFSSDRTRLYLITRAPDRLLVVHLQDPLSDSPQVFVDPHDVELPAFPNMVEVVSRTGMGDLLAITSEEEDTVTFYDAEKLTKVSQVENVGNSPYGITTQRVGAGARFFVSNFADGQVAVLDMPDLAAPEQVHLVARLGKPQGCLITETEKDCDGEN